MLILFKIILYLFIYPSFALTRFLPELAKINSHQFCVQKKEGCNSCELSLHEGQFSWSCTELLCPDEPQKSLKNKCIKHLDRTNFLISSFPQLEQCVVSINREKKCEVKLSLEKGLGWNCEYNKHSLPLEKAMCLVDINGKKNQENIRLINSFYERERNKQNNRVRN